MTVKHDGINSRWTLLCIMQFISILVSSHNIISTVFHSLKDFCKKGNYTDFSVHKKILNQTSLEIWQCLNENQILNIVIYLFFFFFTATVFYRPLKLANRTMHTAVLCHQPISCHGFSTAAEDVLNWKLGHDIRGTTIRKPNFEQVDLY